MSVAVDVGHGHARGPAGSMLDAGLSRDVLKMEVPPVQVEGIGPNVRREVKIGQAVAINVAACAPAAVVEEFILEGVEPFAASDVVAKAQPRLRSGNQFEERPRFVLP